MSRYLQVKLFIGIASLAACISLGCLTLYLAFLKPSGHRGLTSKRRVAQRSVQVLQLIEQSETLVSPEQRPFIRSVALTSEDVSSAEDFINGNPSYRSYHLLLALRRQEPARYKALSPSIRASVLCSALTYIKPFNDWGHLGPDLEPNNDFEAAHALLETGGAAIPYLIPLLDNLEEAPHYGSAESTLSRVYKYRRADFAYRYISLILNRPVVFDADPAERDKHIQQLKKALRLPHSQL